MVTQDQVTNSIEVNLLEDVVDSAGTDKLVKVSTKASPLLLLVGISGENVVFDCNTEESLCMQTSLLVAVNKQGQICGVETIGPAAKTSALKSAVEKVSTTASDIFKFYFN